MNPNPANAFSGRRVLVTGGAGFVGGSLVNRLAEAGARVTVLDDLFTGRAEVLPTSVQLIEGSVEDWDLVRRLVNESSVVFHLAARNIIASTKDPKNDFATNIGGTLNVLMAARECSIDRVVYTGSTSIYGNPRSIPINEDDGITPLSPYAVSKLAGEHYAVAFYESYGTPISIVRYSNVFGVGQRPDNPYCGVISKFFASAYAGKSIQVHGDGEQTRDFTYIDDAVNATMLAAIHPRAEGEVFNVGTGIETSINALVRLIGLATERELDVNHIDRRDIDNIRRRVVNIEKIRRMLRWTPQWTLDRGLAETAAWFRASSFAREDPADQQVVAGQPRG
jgi:UDP-glucose 4-epimerase